MSSTHHDHSPGGPVVEDLEGAHGSTRNNNPPRPSAETVNEKPTGWMTNQTHGQSSLEKQSPTETINDGPIYVRIGNSSFDFCA